jgi:hypothetical protein
MDISIPTFPRLLMGSMIRCLLLFFLIGSLTSVSADNSSRGYLITKNGKKLTGLISQVLGENEIIFINDFGTPYKLHAALIYGFVVPQKGKNVFYVSKFSGNVWRFMRLLHEGEGMSLYLAPVARVLPNDAAHYGMRSPEMRYTNDYFVELKGRMPVRVSRGNFKKSMRRLLKKEAPELAKKIGKKGYRFKNLEAVIQEYNDLLQKEMISM